MTANDDRLYPLQDFTPDECATYSRIMCAEPAPESYVQQHTFNDGTCFCGPVQVGTLGVWTHNMGDEQ